MANRYSGGVAVEVVFDRKARTHRLSEPGAYRAYVAFRHVNDSLIIGVPENLKDAAISDDDTKKEEVADEIAQTALNYTLGDHPDLPVERDSEGMVVVRRNEEFGIDERKVRRRR